MDYNFVSIVLKIRNFQMHAYFAFQNLTYRILNFTRDGIPYRDQRRIFRKAFNLWESSSGLTIREVYFGNADILISFVRQRHGDDFPFDREGGTLAHAFYPLSNRGRSLDSCPQRTQLVRF